MSQEIAYFIRILPKKIKILTLKIVRLFFAACPIFNLSWFSPLLAYSRLARKNQYKPQRRADKRKRRGSFSIFNYCINLKHDAFHLKILPRKRGRFLNIKSLF